METIEKKREGEKQKEKVTVKSELKVTKKIFFCLQ